MNRSRRGEGLKPPRPGGKQKNTHERKTDMIDYTFPLTIAGETVATESKLLSDVEDGEYMSEEAVRYIVVHCTATRADRGYTVEQLARDHRRRGFRTIGYHFYVRRDGTATQHRRLLEVGAHCRPWNRCSIGVCYEGGLDATGKPADTRTEAQRTRLAELLRLLRRAFPQAEIRGHRDMANATPKDCPCFDASGEYANL